MKTFGVLFIIIHYVNVVNFLRLMYLLILHWQAILDKVNDHYQIIKIYDPFI